METTPHSDGNNTEWYEYDEGDDENQKPARPQPDAADYVEELSQEVRRVQDGGYHRAAPGRSSRWGVQSLYKYAMYILPTITLTEDDSLPLVKPYFLSLGLLYRGDSGPSSDPGKKQLGRQRHAELAAEGGRKGSYGATITNQNPVMEPIGIYWP
ncbi:hypothetical protein PtA15_9A565 [Puccinia triticina]|uniref:Uncharacterized protein n=1 Tax=Puccinia triticina TaxID=208348 RepID=A0ABY7CVR9_9BASI|nr:uncharacterized protein PtA15_9A565 [Puccinia triticina]WAQ88438.1 hypothetical protein PtA15_9A565 [Puccinia triticina]